MINFIITMAGKGERFLKEGYKIPKWKLSINNRTLLERSITSLPLNLCSNLFIIYFHEDEKFGIKEMVLSFTKNKVIFIKVKQRTKSQMETAMLAKPYLNPDDKIWDMLGASEIIKKSGGKCYFFKGNLSQPHNFKGIMASNRFIHNQIYKKIYEKF